MRKKSMKFTYLLENEIAYSKEERLGKRFS